MRRYRIGIFGLLFAMIASPAASQNANVRYLDTNGRPVNVDAAHPLPVTGAGGGGGSTYTGPSAAQLPASLGPKSAAQSLSVIASSDGFSIANTAFGATQLGTWDIRNITGTISLPTGAATSAKQPSLGIAGTPSPDVLTIQGVSGGTPVPINASTLPLPSGAATATNQVTANNSLATIAGNTGGIGTPTDAPATTTDTTATTLIAQTKQLVSRVNALITALGSPFQAGGSIGNGSFGISGTLPAYAATPTFNIGTAPTLLDNSNLYNGTTPAVWNTTTSADFAVSGVAGFLGTNAFGRLYNPLTSAWSAYRGDATGAWTHPPASTVVVAGGTITASGGTAALTFTNTTDGEVINPSTGTLWASWGTPAVNGANSFPINAGGSYRPPSRVAGTLTLLSTAASQTYTFNKF